MTQLNTLSKMIALPIAAALLMGNAPQTYTLDTKASSVAAKVPFLGIGSRTATFNTLTGSVAFVPDKPSAAKVNVTIHTRDIKAPDSLTLKRLKSEKFFWVDKYPKATFKGSNLTMTSARKGRISGTLTARGVTRAETLFVTFDRPPTQAAGKAINLTGTMKINRRNYGMTSFALVVGKTVTINLKARMVPR
ncbi:MAG: YceI family protein [Marinomonas sp.]|uniref:YceI family protein n=1 Tax=Parasphingorhabdus sp. TaxID=2709688 RepID=UPI00327D4B83